MKKSILAVALGLILLTGQAHAQIGLGGGSSGGTVDLVCDGTLGAAAPSGGCLMAGEDPSGDMQALKVDSSRRLIVTLGTTLQGKDAAGLSYDTITVYGTATTAAPTYTTATNNALSLDLAGSLRVVPPDPCQANTKVFININQTGNTQLVTGTASKKIYVCALNVIAAAAQNISFVAGTGSVCATSTVAVPGLSGGTTAALGWNLAANSGGPMGSGGFSIAATTVNADNLCLFQSGSAQLSGGIAYVTQ